MSVLSLPLRLQREIIEDIKTAPHTITLYVYRIYVYINKV